MAIGKPLGRGHPLFARVVDERNKHLQKTRPRIEEFPTSSLSNLSFRVQKFKGKLQSDCFWSCPKWLLLLNSLIIHLQDTEQYKTVVTNNVDNDNVVL